MNQTQEHTLFHREVVGTEWSELRLMDASVGWRVGDMKGLNPGLLPSAHHSADSKN